MLRVVILVLFDKLTSAFKIPSINPYFASYLIFIQPLFGVG